MSGLIERHPERCRALYNRYVKQAEEKLFEDHVNNHETLCLSSTLMSHVYITDSDDEESRTCLGRQVLTERLVFPFVSPQRNTSFPF